MADIFLQDDALKCLRGKSVVFLGDSIMRNIYQDFVTLLFTGKMSSHEHVLKKKGEMIPRYYGDRLVPGTGRLTKGRDFSKDATMVGFWEKSQKSDQMPYFGQNLVGF